MESLKDCPVCGAGAVILKCEPDGNFMGYAVGCPRYRKNDGVHTRKMFFSNASTREKAIEKWNEYCEVFFNET
jgi:hypothetical protein